MRTENFIPHDRTQNGGITPVYSTPQMDVREARFGVQRCERFEVWAQQNNPNTTPLPAPHPLQLSGLIEAQADLRVCAVDLVSYQRPKSGGDWKEVCRGGYGGAKGVKNADEAIKEANRAFEAHVTQSKPAYVPKAWAGAKVNAVAAQVPAALGNAEKVAKFRASAQLNLGGVP